jgi:hypothetical protein
MKELKLLPESWEPEIDYSGIEIVVRNGVVHQVDAEKQHDGRLDSGVPMS